jgi:glycosyltransferase involved in cell wall biosynthesis
VITPSSGVLFAGFVPGSGYGNAARDYLALLDGHGIPVQWVPLQGGSRRWGKDYFAAPPMGALPPSVANARLAQNEITPAVALLHTPREFWAKLRSEYLSPRTLLYTTFEQTVLPELTVRLINEYDGVIVPSRFNLEFFRESGVRVPMWVVPHVVADPGESPHPKGDAALALPPEATADTFVVTVVGPWQARKAIDASIEAFLRAFGPEDDALLVIKTTDRDYVTQQPSPVSVARILGRYGRRARVHLLMQTLRYETLMALMRRSDCALSLTRGEGFGLTIAESIVQGTPVVTTGWGAPPEFLGADYPFLVDFKMRAVASEPTDGWADTCGDWAVADIDHAASLLQLIRRNRAAAHNAVKTAQRQIARTCSSDVVGAALIGVLESAGGLPRQKTLS